MGGRKAGHILTCQSRGRGGGMPMVGLASGRAMWLKGGSGRGERAGGKGRKGGPLRCLLQQGQGVGMPMVSLASGRALWSSGESGRGEAEEGISPSSRREEGEFVALIVAAGAGV